jgi:hypothetical protein
MMKKTSKRRLRLTIDFNDNTVFRVIVKERNRERKYVCLERPWGAKELAGFKLAKKVVTMVARGVADLAEVRTAATAPRRRKATKKPRAKEVGVSRANRSNGADHAIAW